ncbi:hypothetical protein Tco_1479633, partial [Tanacetum coccineum]
DYKMVVKEIVSRLLEEEEKLEWWFEQDIDKEEERFEGDEYGEDIQCAGSDTRPPMLDKADFASWQQRIRLYCRGKENGVNILKSIDEGPFQMGTTRGIIAEGTEGPINLGPERLV